MYEGLNLSGAVFDGCPECGSFTRRINVGKLNWLVCEDHKTAWPMNGDRVKDWMFEPEAIHIENKRRLDEDYTIVEPIKTDSGTIMHLDVLSAEFERYQEDGATISLRDIRPGTTAEEIRNCLSTMPSLVYNFISSGNIDFEIKPKLLNYVCPQCGHCTGDFFTKDKHWHYCQEHMLAWFDEEESKKSINYDTSVIHEANERRLEQYEIVPPRIIIENSHAATIGKRSTVETKQHEDHLFVGLRLSYKDDEESLANFICKLSEYAKERIKYDREHPIDPPPSVDDLDFEF